MKNLYLIGGAMGVGKTTVCQRLKLKLNNSVFLDGAGAGMHILFGSQKRQSRW